MLGLVLELVFDLLLLGGYVVGAMVIGLAIQLVVYQVTGFSIYNWLNKKLFEEIM